MTRAPGTSWAGEQLEQIAVAVTRPRRCPYFYRLQPGNSPEKHLELKRAAEKTRSDRAWDIVKIGAGFALGVITTLVSVAAKSWYDQLRSLAP